MQTPSLANCIRVWYVAFQLPNQHAVLIHLADKGTPNLPDLPLKVLWSFRIGSFGRAERRTSRSTGTCSAPCWTEPSSGCASPSPPAISGTGVSWASCRTSWRCPLGRSQTARGRRTPSASRSRRRRPPSWWRRWASDTGSEGRRSSALWGRRQGVFVMAEEGWRKEEKSVTYQLCLVFILQIEGSCMTKWDYSEKNTTIMISHMQPTLPWLRLRWWWWNEKIKPNRISKVTEETLKCKIHYLMTISDTGRRTHTRIRSPCQETVPPSQLFDAVHDKTNKAPGNGARTGKDGLREWIWAHTRANKRPCMRMYACI